jgi:hypothetical protein
VAAPAAVPRSAAESATVASKGTAWDSAAWRCGRAAADVPRATAAAAATVPARAKVEVRTILIVSRCKGSVVSKNFLSF